MNPYRLLRRWLDDRATRAVIKAWEKAYGQKAHRLVGGQVIYNVHDAAACFGYCSVHNPDPYRHTSEWPQNWRPDTGRMERICPHGIGHPDPDEMDYLRSRLSGRELLAGDVIDLLGVHGCDGCCHEGKNDVP